MRRIASILLATLILLTGVTVAADYYTKFKGDEKQFGEATDEMALVYVVRPATLGGAIKTWSFYDDTLIGVGKVKSYTFALVPPGEHIFWSKAENTSAIELEVEAGKTYYFKQKILPGLGKARVKMTRIDEAEAKKALKKCGYTVPTEEGRARAEEIIANRLERAENKVADKKKKKGEDE